MTKMNDIKSAVAERLLTAEDDKKYDDNGLKDACWDNYKAVGFKMKNGKRVPNCVPASVAAVAKRLTQTSAKGVKVSDVLSQKHYDQLTMLCDAAIGLEVSSQLTAAAKAALDSRFPTASALMADVSIVLNFFGGGCFKSVCQPLSSELAAKLEEEADLF